MFSQVCVTLTRGGGRGWTTPNRYQYRNCTVKVTMDGNGIAPTMDGNGMAPSLVVDGYLVHVHSLNDQLLVPVCVILTHRKSFNNACPAMSIACIGFTKKRNLHNSCIVRTVKLSNYLA